MIQWLRLCTSTAEDVGLIPGWGTRLAKEKKNKHTKLSTKKKFEREESGESFKLICIDYICVHLGLKVTKDFCLGQNVWSHSKSK